METKTHWKKLDNPNYLGAYSLLGVCDELTVKIDRVVTEDVKTDRGSEPCRVAYLKGQKPMIVNTTNAKVIEKVLGSAFIEDWAGREITIYVAKVKAFGDMIDALRVREVKPKTKLLPLTKGTDNWAKVVTALKGGIAIDAIKTKYQLTEQNIIDLKTESAI